MTSDIDRVVHEFRNAMSTDAIVLRAEVRLAPHEPSLRAAGWQGVYAFRLGSTWLKVGKAGPMSGPRWGHQHYNPGSSNSNLALSLIKYSRSSIVEPRLPGDLKERLREIHPDDLGQWLRQHTDRGEFLIDVTLGKSALDLLEGVCHRALNPAFEGRWRYGDIAV